MHIQIHKELCEKISAVFKNTMFENWDVEIQVDGAGPHSCKYAEDAIVRRGYKNIPRALFRRQNAQSPLENLNDLCVYSHLVNGQNGTGKADYNTQEELMASIDHAWENMPAKLLEWCVALKCVTYKAL